MNEGMNWEIQGWVHKATGPSMHLLTDRYLENWSAKDTKCIVHLQTHAHIGLWIQAIRNQKIQLYLLMVVLAVQCTKQIECLEPLKTI